MSEDHNCGICHELMVDPTTLTCGHTFCHHCLAEWRVSSNRQECPLCRKKWLGWPGVNIAFRNMIQALHPDEYQARERGLGGNYVLSQTIWKILSTTRAAPSASTPQPTNYFWNGVLMTLALCYVLFMVVGFRRPSYTDVLADIPLQRWSENDVQHWVAELGPWTKYRVQPALADKQLDGYQLWLTHEKELMDLLHNCTSVEQQMVLHAVNDMKSHGKQPPNDFWEFVDTHPLTTLFLLGVFPDCPRTVVLFLYMFDYRYGYLPLVHISTPGGLETTGRHLYLIQYHAANTGEWKLFWFTLLTMPSTVALQFIANSNLLRSNPWLSILGIVGALSMWVVDMSDAFGWYQDRQNLWDMKAALAPVIGACIFAIIFYLLYSCLPHILFKLFVCFLICRGTFVPMMRAYHIIRQRLT